MQKTSVNRLSPSRNPDSIIGQNSARRFKSLIEVEKRPSIFSNSRVNPTEIKLKESILGSSMRRRQTISNINDEHIDRKPFNLERLEDFERGDQNVAF